MDWRRFEMLGRILGNVLAGFEAEHCQSTALGCLLLIVHIVGLHFVNHIEYFKGRAYNV